MAGVNKTQNYMVTYDINDKHCPEGHKWIRVNSSLLFPDYYYCEECDKIYTPTVEEKTKEWFEENYTSDRRSELVKRAILKDVKK